jgi:hypothetical protein
VQQLKDINENHAKSIAVNKCVGWFHPFIGDKGPWEEHRYHSTLFLTSALEVGGRWGGPHLTPGKDPVPIVQEAGWASGLVWAGAENLAPTGI